jgi:hypothetical protein
MIFTKEQELEAKRQDVRKAYVKFGFTSPEYNKQFEELHELNMAFMHAKYNDSRGLPYWKNSPYNS